LEALLTIFSASLLYTDPMYIKVEEYLIDQNWEHFSPQEHETWSVLFERQRHVLVNRAVPEFLQGVDQLGIAAHGIPRFEDLSVLLREATGWEIVAVPGLVPDEVFFALLAQRRFPSTCFIRRQDQMDYLQEPDIFHDIFGHVPLLVNPIFADYMEAYGQQGLAAMDTGCLHYLARLYWYTVEFGLIQTPKGLRTYGSGIVSSYGESVYCLESPKPNRIRFDRNRIMRTNYRIDAFQETYFVIDSFAQLMAATVGDLLGEYKELSALPDFTPQDVLPVDQFVSPNIP
jgi:phenylalanine-4-hydroxylase